MPRNGNWACAAPEHGPSASACSAPPAIAANARAPWTPTSPAATARWRARCATSWRPTPPLGRPLVAGLPYLRAEAVYAVRHEMAGTVDDVLTRRTRARLQDRSACVDAAPAVADLLAGELGWSPEEAATHLSSFVTACLAEDIAQEL